MICPTLEGVQNVRKKKNPSRIEHTFSVRCQCGLVLSLHLPSVGRQVEAPEDLMRYIVPKGFIAIDGTSLTVCEVDTTERTFTVMLVAYTQVKKHEKKSQSHQKYSTPAANNDPRFFVCLFFSRKPTTGQTQSLFAMLLMLAIFYEGCAVFFFSNLAPENVLLRAFF